MTETRRDPAHHVRRAAAFVPATFDKAQRTIDVVFTAGSDVDRRDWWTGERWVESLEITPEAMDLTRLNAGAPVLNAHGAYDLGDVIGVVERAWIEKGKGMASLRLSARDDVAPIAADIEAGVLRNISVGYVVSEWRETDEKGVKRRTATRWQPMEISFVPIPADPAAQVRSERPQTAGAASAAGLAAPAAPAIRPGGASGAEETSRAVSSQSPATPAATKESDMPETVVTAPAQPDAESIRAEATKAERARCVEIREAAKLAGLDDAWATAQIESGAKADDARREALAEMGKRKAPETTAAATITRDATDTVMQGVEGALAARMGTGKWEGPAEEYRGAALVDLAAATLRARNVNIRGWSRADIARAALGLPVSGRASPYQTSSDFATLLTNVQSKRLLGAYAAFDRNFLSFCHKRALPDFKTTQIVELGAAPALLALAEGGQIQTGAIQDGGETYNLVRYARNVGLSYVALVNDDLGGFDRMPLAFATSAANLENATVYSLLSTNANMADGNALFSTAHGNTSAQGATVDGISATRALMRRQTDPTGQQIMVTPSVIIAPVELEATFLALFSPDVTPSGVATTSVNPWRGTFDIVTTAFLTDTNDYFVAVPAGSGYEAIEVGYESGNEAPQLTTFTEPDRDGLVFSLRHSFGAKAATWRTIARATA